MGKRLQEIFKVRPGEGRTVALVLALTFLASAGGSVGGNAIEALFYARQGVSALPLLYMALGTTTFVVTLAITALLGRISRVRLYLALPLVLAAAIALQRAVILLDIPWTYAIFWLLMNVEGSLQGLLAWGVAAIACDTRQAKRLFPLFAAGGILGGVIGGFATRPLAGLVGTENLLLIWTAALLGAFLVARVLLSGRVTPRSAGATSLADDLQAGFRYVWSATLWRAISVATVLFAVLYFSIAFPFSKAATAAYPRADELAGFFGLFGGLSTGAAFLASLFVANRLYARIGLMGAILIFPVLYAAGFATLFVTQTVFSAVVAFRFAQVVYLQGIAGTAYESVFNVIPSERRDQVRAFVNGVPDQAGIVIAGAVLLVGDRALDSSRLALIGLAAALLCAFVWRRASAKYANELVRTLRAGQPQVFYSEDEPFGGFRRDAAAVASLRAAATDPDVRTRRLATEMLGHLDSAADVLASALADADHEVRLAAATALAPSSPAALEAALDDRDPAVRATAAAALLERLPDRAAPIIAAFAESIDPDARLTAVHALAAARGPRATDLIVRLARDDDPRIRAAAVRALAGSPDAAPAILAAAIRDPRRAVRIAAADTIAKIGSSALGVAIDALGDSVASDDAIDALRRMPAAARADRVTDFARQEAVSARRYHDLARGVVAADERKALARDALVRSARQHAHSALGALASLAGGDAFDTALTGLRSRDATQRANALETLDTVGDRELVRPLLAVFEDVSPTSHATDLSTLRDDADPWIAEVSTFAHDPAPGGATVETLATLPLMERILFFRQVPLFADLPPADLKQIAAIAAEQLYPDGTTIAREGEVGSELLIIAEGEVRVVTGGMEIARRTRGDYVGEMAVLDGEPRSATLVAAGQVRALRVGRRELETILRERPETGLAMLVALTRRIREMMKTPAR